jgi:hyperosmotically inducible protein
VGTVSSVFADEMPAKSDQPVTDTWITTKVKSELATTDGVKSTKISVTTKDGIVALVGVLASKDSFDKAIAATESVKGVKKVDSSGLKVK